MFFQVFISQFIYFNFIPATNKLLLRTGTDPKPTCGSWLAGSIKQQVHQVIRGLAARGDSSLEKKWHQISTHDVVNQSNDTKKFSGVLKDFVCFKANNHVAKMWNQTLKN